jgi:hypothetical protein
MAAVNFHEQNRLRHIRMCGMKMECSAACPSLLFRESPISAGARGAAQDDDSRCADGLRANLKRGVLAGGRGDNCRRPLL